MYIVSACLAGINCRYDGTGCENSFVMALIKSGKAIPICPEVLGGLSTPRACSEILDGKVITKDGNDVTKEYLNGAQKVLKIAKIIGAKKAILKQRSPSCGCGKIYDGTFSGKKVPGNGVTAELLQKNGIEVITEEEIKEESY